VLNTGVVPIDGVAFGLGVVNAAAQIGADRQRILAAP
jgi:hypothetical protein